ncbi:MAG TPA: hypothetical protein VFL15_02655 [Gammaproteobacteria bacterium]|nr:hypothetical protein [Gammaproteobacteria bacterium]
MKHIATVVLMAVMTIPTAAVHAANYNFISGDYFNTSATDGSDSGTGYALNFSHSVFADKMFISGRFEHHSLDYGSYYGGDFVNVVSAKFGYHLALSRATDLVLAVNCLHSREKSMYGTYTPYIVECGPEAGIRSRFSDRFEFDAFAYGNRVVESATADSAISVGLLYDVGGGLAVGAEYLQTSSFFSNSRQWTFEVRWDY